MKIKKNIHDFFIRNKIFFITFLIAFIIMMIAFAVCGMFPFGDRQILVIDAWHQYYPFLSEFHNKIQHGESILYNHNIGLGVNFSLMRAYYTNSPLNWLSILFPHKYLTEFMMLATAMKIAFAATFMAMLLHYLHKKEDLADNLLEDISTPQPRPRGHEKDIFPAVFGLLYAFSTYLMGYYWCIMWLDAVALLPLIILGLHKLIRKENHILYSVTLAIAIISNYYIGYMLCLFIAFYYLYLMATDYKPKSFKKFLQQTFSVVIYSIIGVGLSSIVLLPVIKGMKLASAAKFTFPKKFVFKRPFIEVLNRMLIGVEPAVVKGLPNITIGTLGLYSLYLYFKNKQIKVSEKMASFIFLLFMLLSCCTNMFNFVWHGMHYPNGIPFRFAFVFVFFMITIAYKGFLALETFTSRDVLTFLAVGVIYLIYSEGGNVGEIVALVSILALCAYGVLLEAKVSKKIKQSTFAVMLTVLVLAESLGSAIYGVATTGSSKRSGYRLYEEDINSALAEMRRIDDSIYRSEFSRIYTTNDSSLYGYRGASVFSSTINSNVTEFVRKLGSMGAKRSNRYSLPMSSPILDSLLNIKYFIGRNELGDEAYRGYTELGKWNHVRLMKNNYALPLGFFAPTSTVMFDNSSSNPFTVQENLYTKLTKENIRIYDQQDIEISYENANETYDGLIRHNYTLKNKSKEGKAKITFTALEDGDYYIYCYAPKVQNGDYKISQDGKESSKLEHYEVRRGIIVPTGKMKAGGRVEIDLKLEKNHNSYIDICIVKCDFFRFAEAFNKINEHPLEITKFEDTHIEGNINAPKSGYCMISIPYEKGWTAKVNGEDVVVSNLKNALLMIPVEAGINNIELNYMPDGLAIGMIISGGSLLALVGLAFLKKHQSKSTAKKETLTPPLEKEPSDQTCKKESSDQTCKKESSNQTCKKESSNQTAEPNLN